MGLIESVSEVAEKSWLCLVADSVSINQLSLDGSHSLVVDSGGSCACVSEKLCHTRDIGCTA